MGYDYRDEESAWDDAIYVGAIVIWALGIAGVVGIILGYF